MVTLIIVKRGQSVRLTDNGVATLSKFLITKSDLIVAAGRLTVKATQKVTVDDCLNYQSIYVKEFPDCLFDSFDFVESANGNL